MELIKLAYSISLIPRFFFLLFLGNKHFTASQFQGAGDILIEHSERYVRANWHQFSPRIRLNESCAAAARCISVK